MTVNTAAGNPMLMPFGPSQSAGTVRATSCGGTVTFAEARQAAAYAGREVNSMNLHRGRDGRTTEDGSGPCPWVWHLLVLLNQLGIHACNFAVIYAIEDGFGEPYIAGSRGWQQQFRSCTSNRCPPHTPGNRQKCGRSPQYVLTWIAENAGAHADSHWQRQLSFRPFRFLSAHSRRSSTALQECRRVGWPRYSRPFRRH